MKFKLFIAVAILMVFKFSVIGQIRVATDGKIGLCGITTSVSHLHLGFNQWMRFNANTGTAGILFYETGSSTANEVEYGAKVFYDGSKDRFSIVTRQQNLERFGITLRRWSGYVGIGMDYDPSYTLDVNGYVRATNIQVSSDMRLKKDINTFDKKSAAKVHNLNAITFKPALRGQKSDTVTRMASLTDTDTTVNFVDKEANRTLIGLSAQEVKEQFPELVSEDEQGYLSVDYIGLIPVLIEAVKEQQQQIEALTAEVERLKVGRKR